MGCAVGCAGKIHVNSYPILVAQRQIPQSEEVTGVKELVPGGRWYLEQKGTRGLISVSIDYTCVFFRDGPQSVFSGQCFAERCLPRKL